MLFILFIFTIFVLLILHLVFRWFSTEILATLLLLPIIGFVYMSVKIWGDFGFWLACVIILIGLIWLGWLEWQTKQQQRLNRQHQQQITEMIQRYETFKRELDDR